MFITVDLVQAEWVVTAFLAKDARMIEVYRTGADPHLRTGHLISGAPEDLIKLEAKVLGHETDPDILAKGRRKLFSPEQLAEYFFPRVMVIRQAGKKSNHALDYNMGYKRFALENEMTEADAKRCVEGYHDAYSGLRTFYYPWIRDQIKRSRMLETCFGEVRTFYKDLTDYRVLETAYAFIPQSTVGRLTNIGLRRIYDAERAILHDVEPLSNEHDGLVLQTTCYVDNAEHMYEILHAVDACMTETLCYHEQEFIINREFKIAPRHRGQMLEVPNLQYDTIKRVLDEAAAL